ncbi:hypothetical protein [Parabacteroides provencensis]|uniref:hypothetical protein n=1 Tax=Parabacteroides provencensis TaxID=1944636 RepID=UPI000C14B040|nr:hypothetical protein [Parabacteroides provencensis]
MELKEFISDVLLQIAEGVTDANRRYKELGGFVNPRGSFKIEGMPYILKESKIPNSSISMPLIPVQFKTHVQLEEKAETKGAGSCNIIKIISASIGSSVGESMASVQEVSFSVPVLLPSEIVK